MRRSPVVVAAALALLLAGTVAAGVGATDARTDSHVEPCAAEQPADFDAPDDDVIGWVPFPPDTGDDTDSGDGNETNASRADWKGTVDQDSADSSDAGWPTPGVGGETAGSATEPGTWYDEPVEVDQSDGLDQEELDLTVARTAARVEALRCRSFERVPPVRVINRTELSQVQEAELYDRSREARRFDDARLDVGMFLDDGRNATEARLATRTAAVLAFYDPRSGEIVLVAENESAPRIDEGTLAHELVHALQDQHFDLFRFDSSRVDPMLAEDGTIEGDAALVETRYRNRCDDGSWTGECLSADAPDADARGNVGLQLLLSQPYNDGPQFVQHVYEDDGWAGVDGLYEAPPNSTWHVMVPETYGSFSPRSVELDRNRTNGSWEPLDPSRAPATDVLGPATIGSVLMAPTFERDTENVLSVEAVQQSSGADPTDVGGPYRYRHDAVEGWQGDRLAAFVDDANRTGAVWRTSWATAGDATTFRARYLDVVEARGGVQTDVPDTYQFPAGSDRDGALYVTTEGAEGTEIVVVFAPDLESIPELYPDAPREPIEDPEPEDEAASSTNGPDPEPTEDEPEDAQALGGLAVAAVAVLLASAGLALRSRP